MEQILYLLESLLINLIGIYRWLIIGYILMSWVPSLRESAIGRFLEMVCEPFLAPFRKIIPPIGGMLDISPILAIFLLSFAPVGIDTLFDMIYNVLL